MSLAPVRDRTIRMTLESDLAKDAEVVSLSTTKHFTDRFLPSNGVAGYVAKKLLPSKTLVLRGPMSISIKFAAGVAEENGLGTSFLQPWFIESVPITIHGQSYLGAYPLLSVGDRDVERILKMFKTSLNDFVSLSGSNESRSRVLLDLQGNPKGARKFLGYIRGLTWDEDVKAANILNYTMEFIGRNVDNASVARGKVGAEQAADVSQGRGHA